MKIILWLLLCVHINTFATDFRIDGERIYISGFLSYGDRDVFLSRLNEFPNIKTVVFKKCLGGHAGAAIYYSEIIREKKLDTIVNTQCHSACAIAFLAGKNRSFENKIGTHMMLFHLARDSDGKSESINVNKRLMKLMDQFTDGKLKNPVRAYIESSSRESAGVIFVSSNYKIFKRNVTLYCDGTEGSDISKCKPIEDADPFELGIVTVEDNLNDE